MERLDIPADRAKSLFLYLDGLRFACAVCLANWERAISSLREVENGLSRQTRAPTSTVVLIISDLWTIVDAVHRARLLSARTPYLKKALGGECQIFDRQTRSVEEMRHYIQHLDERIVGRADASTPVWGSISWQSATEPNKAFTLIAGTPAVTQHAVSLVWDRQESKFVRELELVVGNSILDVAALVKAVRRFDACLSKWSETIKLENGSGYTYSPENTPILSMTVSRRTIE